MSNKFPNDEQRFWSKVAIGDGCWEWRAGRFQATGYGQFRHNGRPQTAHRAAYALWHGDEPGDLFVLHKCDNRRCVRPGHLFLGTAKDNMRDMDKKGRRVTGGGGPPGERNGAAKLTAECVRAIRKDGRTHKKIAADYGVSRRAISKIKSAETWGHVREAICRAL